MVLGSEGLPAVFHLLGNAPLTSHSDCWFFFAHESLGLEWPFPSILSAHFLPITWNSQVLLAPCKLNDCQDCYNKISRIKWLKPQNIALEAGIQDQGVGRFSFSCSLCPSLPDGRLLHVLRWSFLCEHASPGSLCVTTFLFFWGCKSVWIRALPNGFHCNVIMLESSHLQIQSHSEEMDVKFSIYEF